jgi:MFS family permease
MPFSPRQWIIVVLCTLAVIFDGYEMQMISYVMPIISKEWHLTPIQSGMIGSWGFVGMLFGAIILGILADYIGRKKTLILGLSVFSVFIGCGMFSQGFVQLATFRFLGGLGMGGVLPIAITLISEFAPIRLRARTIGVVTGGFTLGFALAATLSTVIEKFLIHLNVSHVAVGFDFTFGRYGIGKAEDLVDMANNRFDVTIVPLIKNHNGVKISSTLIRENIKSGDIGAVNSYLGWYYMDPKSVVSGSSFP